MKTSGVGGTYGMTTAPGVREGLCYVRKQLQEPFPVTLDGKRRVTEWSEKLSDFPWATFHLIRTPEEASPKGTTP
jgi:hypothetical protein